MAKAVAAIADRGLRNIRLFDGDAVRLLDWLPPASLAEIDLLYPDPWPKKRHWKRRFVSPANLDRFARVLVPGGLFRFASDIDAYVDWTLLHLRGAAISTGPPSGRTTGGGPFPTGRARATRRRRSRRAASRPTSRSNVGECYR